MYQIHVSNKPLLHVGLDLSSSAACNMFFSFKT